MEVYLQEVQESAGKILIHPVMNNKKTTEEPKDATKRNIMNNSAATNQKRQKSPDTKSTRWPFSFNPFHNENNRFLSTPTNKEKANVSTLSYCNPFSVLLRPTRGRIQSRATIPQTKITKSNAITEDEISSKNLDDQVNTKQVTNTTRTTVSNDDETIEKNCTFSKERNENKQGVASKCDTPSDTSACEQTQIGAETLCDSEIEVPKLLADRNVADDLLRSIPTQTNEGFSQTTMGANVESSSKISDELPLPKPEFVSTKKQNLQKLTTPASIDPKIKAKHNINGDDQRQKGMGPFSSTSHALHHQGEKNLAPGCNQLPAIEKNGVVNKEEAKIRRKSDSNANCITPTRNERPRHIDKHKRRQGHTVSFEPGSSGGWKDGEDGKSESGGDDGKQTGRIYRRSQRTKKRKRGATTENDISNSTQRSSKQNEQKVVRRRLSRKATRRVATNALVGYLQRHQTIKAKRTRRY